MMLNPIAHGLLWILALQFNLRPSLKRAMRCCDGWMDLSVGFKSRSVEQAILFKKGRARVIGKLPDSVDVTLRFQDDQALKEMALSTPNEVLNLILKNRMVLEGNFASLQVFNYYTSLVLGGVHRKMLARARKKERAARSRAYRGCARGGTKDHPALQSGSLCSSPAEDPGVKYLKDPYLGQFRLDDFPRLKAFYRYHFDTLPEICAERPGLMTRWFRENGFETGTDGKPWTPQLRQALAFRHLMRNKKPRIRENDLLAGTTTSKTVGVTVFPDGQGTMIWGELNSLAYRELIPFSCTRQTARTLHQDVFPFWVNRNFREYVRQEFDYPLCQKLDERFVAYFVWKSVGISHTIPNFRRLLEKGTSGVIEEILLRGALPGVTQEEAVSLAAMKIALEGVEAFAQNLSQQARALALDQRQPKRRKELERLAQICATVPRGPAQTLDEAMNALWILWIGLHMENSNTGLSLGRLDQLLQPYFERQMAALSSEDERAAYTKEAVELAGCLIMRLTDHVPLLPDIANYLFGGAASTQAITLGGVTPDGEDAVNDMTYILLKAVELLPVRDTNINARYHGGKNSDTYLKRLCEVNLVTLATPIMHSDTAVAKSLSPHGYPDSHINDWAATGCVEPSLQGQHFGHTGAILMNLVAALEMALNNGRHPLMQWRPGPETGSVEAGDFASFETFFTAWAVQQRFLIDQAVALNNMMGRAHQHLRPAPLLSAMMDGCIENAADVVNGGARYNSSGTANIGLVDVTDSLMVIKTLVFEKKAVSFQALKRAIDSDFKTDPGLHAMVQNKVAKFGSGCKAALEMCQRVAGVVHDSYSRHENYRGGPYTTGFWSMSQHVAYGCLSGTLPSGRLAGKAFSPGLTPHPGASQNFLDNLLDVAQLNPGHMDNNLAFNVKLHPGSPENRQATVDAMHAYVKAYFQQGGMQMQFNVISSEVLKAAMAHPEDYQQLMVRISGYNAYFVTLNKDIQIELIERAEYGL